MNLTGCLRSFQKICEVKATFLIMVHCRLPFACVGVCADGVDTAEGEPRAPYRRRGTGADRPHRHSSRPSPSRAPSEKGKSSFTKECLWQSSNSNFITSWPFIVSCDKTGSMSHRSLMLQTQAKRLSPEERWCDSLSTKLNEPVAVFAHQHFCLKEQLTDYNYSDLGMWQAFSQNWTK